MFTKEEKGGFRYWAAHWSAYQMTAFNLGVWKPKYIWHDAEKPWLMLWARLFHRSDPYKWVRNVHRKHSSHHLQAYKEVNTTFYLSNGHRMNTISTTGGLDIRAMIIDWECSRYTKEASPLTAYQKYESLKEQGQLTPILENQIRSELVNLGLDKETQKRVKSSTTNTCK